MLQSLKSIFTESQGINEISKEKQQIIFMNLRHVFQRCHCWEQKMHIQKLPSVKIGK